MMLAIPAARALCRWVVPITSETAKRRQAPIAPPIAIAANSAPKGASSISPEADIAEQHNGSDQEPGTDGLYDDAEKPGQAAVKRFVLCTACLGLTDCPQGHRWVQSNASAEFFQIRETQGKSRSRVSLESYLPAVAGLFLQNEANTLRSIVAQGLPRTGEGVLSG